jgi:hypothetical protein
MATKYERKSVHFLGLVIARKMIDTHHTVRKIHKRNCYFEKRADPTDIGIYQINRVRSLLNTRRQNQVKYRKKYQFEP